jgi:hypothetical protein
MIDHIPLLTELEESCYLLSYRHAAPTELRNAYFSRRVNMK